MSKKGRYTAACLLGFLKRLKLTNHTGNKFWDQSVMVGESSKVGMNKFCVLMLKNTQRTYVCLPRKRFSLKDKCSCQKAIC